MFGFRKLQVWQMARDLVIEIYSLTRTFPSEEKFGLVVQINRAAISVVSNLAEGSGRASRKDQAHFTQISYGSLMELACQLEISKELDFINMNSWNSMNEKIKNVAEKLSALRRSQLSRHNERVC
jgi:four helix bundle protein